MNYVLHPAAALEHEEQVAYYEARSPGLGRRYHAAFRSALLHVAKLLADTKLFKRLVFALYRCTAFRSA